MSWHMLWHRRSVRWKGYMGAMTGACLCVRLCVWRVPLSLPLTGRLFAGLVSVFSEGKTFTLAA